MTIRVKGASGDTIRSGDMPTAMHVVLESDQILEIRDIGVSVFD